MAAPVLTNFLISYQLSNNWEMKKQIAGKMLEYLITWMGEEGENALQYEAEVLRKLQEAGIPRYIVESVKANFNLFRRAAPVIQQVARTYQVTGPQIWQGLMESARQIMGQLAGGVQNVGNWIMNGCRNLGSGIGFAAAAIARAGVYVLSNAALAVSRAVAAVVAAVGGWEVVLTAIVGIALFFLVCKIIDTVYKSNQKPYEIEDPVLKRMQQGTFSFPRPFYGNVH